MVLRFQQYFVRQCATKKVLSTLNNKQNNQISETNQRITALQELRLRSELASCNYFCYYCFHIVYNIHSLVEAKLLSYCTLAPGLKRPSAEEGVKREGRNRANTISWIGRDCCTRDLTGSVAACQGLRKITSFNIPLWRGRGTRESTPPMELHTADGFSEVTSQFHWKVWLLVG